MKIIVTGGNGFLGSNVVRKLLKENHDVFVISNNTNNIQDILPQIKYNSNYTDEINNFEPDVIVHFGWRGGNNSQDAHHINQFYDNMHMSLDLLVRLNSLPKKPKFIGVGSFAEYGDYSTPIKESFMEQPLTMYGLTKLTLKNYVEMFSAQNNIEWSWIRPCYVYGPGDVNTRLIPTVINKCLKEEHIHLDLCDKWIDYLYIEDFCNYASHLINSKSQGVYNLSSGNQYYLKHVIELIHNTINKNNKLEFTDANSSPTKWICGDNSKIVSESNYYPSIDFLTGITKTINYYKNETFNNH